MPRKCYQKLQVLQLVLENRPQQTLRIFVDVDLSNQQHAIIIRDTNKPHHPCYNILLKIKEKYYSRYNIMPNVISKDRLILLLSNYQFFLEVVVNLRHKEIKVGLGDKSKNLIILVESKANILMTSFVPPQNDLWQREENIVSQNPTLSSSRLCRQIRFRFVKKNSDITTECISCASVCFH